MLETLDLSPLPSSDVLTHIVDAHCHPTDSPLDEEFFSQVSHRVCAMATRGTDQELVAVLARRYPDKVVPCFGTSGHHNLANRTALTPRQDITLGLPIGYLYAIYHPKRITTMPSSSLMQSLNLTTEQPLPASSPPFLTPRPSHSS